MQTDMAHQLEIKHLQQPYIAAGYFFEYGVVEAWKRYQATRPADGAQLGDARNINSKCPGKEVQVSYQTYTYPLTRSGFAR